MNVISVTLLFLLCHTSLSSSYNILGVFYTPSRTQISIGQAVLRALATRGHNVTSVSSLRLESPLKNYSEIYLGGLAEQFRDSLDQSHSACFHKRLLNQYDLTNEITTEAIRHPKFQKLLYSDSTFDLIIIEATMNEAMLALGHRFNAPVIWFDTTGNKMWTYDLNHLPVALYTRNFQESSLEEHLSFFSRAMNVFEYAAELLYFNYIHLPQQLALYQNYFPDAKLSISELRANVRLLRLNRDFTQSIQQMNVPNSVEISEIVVGGFEKTLAADVQEFMDTATNGVIYSTIDLTNSMLSNETISEIFEAIGKRKEKVLWDTFTNDFFKIPSNVLISRKTPESAIISHPNVKLVVSHGELFTATVAALNGVPSVGISKPADQSPNLAAAVREGFAIQIDFEELSGQVLSKAIDEILSNSEFSKLATSWGNFLKNRSFDSLSNAALWMEDIVRYSLTSRQSYAPKRIHSFIEYHNLDVIIFLLSLVVVAVYVLTVITKKMLILIILYYLNLNVKEKSL